MKRPDERSPLSRASETPARPFRTLLAEHQGLDYDELDDGRGKVRLWHIGHHVGIFESSGSLVQAHSDFITAYHARHIEAFPRPWFTFGNWMTLRAYTPDVRRALTEWQQQQRYDEIYVAHDSRLLAMGVSLANGALDNRIQVLSNEEALDDVLIAVRKRLGI